MDANFSNNGEKQRFELELDKKIAFIDYQLAGETITMLHTEVPHELEGKGIGSMLAAKALDYATIHNLKVIPSCTFIADYIRKHPKYENLVK